MGSSVACFLNCFMQFQGRKKKCIFYPCPKSEEHTWRICQCFTFSPFWRQWQSFLSQNPFCWRLGKGQWENGKVLTSGDLGSLLETGDLWMGLAFNGCGLELGQGMGKSEGGGRTGRANHSYLNPLLPEEEISESATISSELGCPPTI